MFAFNNNNFSQFASESLLHFVASICPFLLNSFSTAIYSRRWQYCIKL